MKVQVAEELRQCTEEHDSMLHERLEHEDRLKKVCPQQNPCPLTNSGLRGCDTVCFSFRSADHHQVMVFGQGAACRMPGLCPHKCQHSCASSVHSMMLSVFLES